MMRLPGWREADLLAAATRKPGRSPKGSARSKRTAAETAADEEARRKENEANAKRISEDRHLAVARR